MSNYKFAGAMGLFLGITLGMGTLYAAWTKHTSEAAFLEAQNFRLKDPLVREAAIDQCIESAVNGMGGKLVNGRSAEEFAVPYCHCLLNKVIEGKINAATLAAVHKTETGDVSIPDALAPSILECTAVASKGAH